MTPDLRRIGEQLLDQFVASVEDRAHGAPVSPDQLRSALLAYLQSPRFTAFLQHAQTSLVEAASQKLLQQKREDPFQRLVTHPLSDAFEAGKLSRALLPNYFSFLHLVLGDTREALTARCLDILRQLRDTQGAAFTWDHFYEDARSKQVLWSVLVRVAESFRRFDARRDWFIGLMQNRHQAISLGPNAFIPRQTTEEPQPFGNEQFNLVFGCLYGPLRRLSFNDAQAFARLCGAPPDELLATFFAQLDAAGADA